MGGGEETLVEVQCSCCSDCKIKETLETGGRRRAYIQTANAPDENGGKKDFEKFAGKWGLLRIVLSRRRLHALPGC